MISIIYQPDDMHATNHKGHLLEAFCGGEICVEHDFGGSAALVGVMAYPPQVRPDFPGVCKYFV